MPHTYKFKFFSTEDNFSDSIEEVLQNCNYEWHEDYGERDDHKGYFFTCQDSNELIEKLKEITGELGKN